MTSNSTLSSSDSRNFNKLQLLRCIIAIFIVLFIWNVVDVGTTVWLAIVSVIAGTLLPSRSLLRESKFIRLVIIHIFVISLVYILFEVIDFIIINSEKDNPQSDFLITILRDHITIGLLCYLTAYFTTWFFWCSSKAVTIEAIFVSIVTVWLLGPHRNYSLDSPKKISQLAWELAIEPQFFLLGLGIILVISIGSYLALASSRPIFFSQNPIRSKGPRNKLLTFGLPTAFLLLMIAYSIVINANYSTEISRTTNGVGQDNTEGQSPLGFHSAVGKTKQPAALVRLEGDFTNNPWAPMLYLREGALSSYNGQEFVIAENRFDTDVPRITPGNSFRSDYSIKNSKRSEVVQSIYLLTKHTSPFAIDYPNVIRQLKNPDPERFSLAYQAQSLAPTTTIDSLINENVGNKKWDEETWKHYLRAPGSLSTEIERQSAFASGKINPENPLLDSNGEDLRYLKVAQDLSTEASSPITKAVAIATYLSQSSIYTRTPGHKLSDRGDPVAAYLFAEEKRGYCVHFAHAAVYLFRLLGIPARIGTGYLTDLQYAKDGHILLHLGDRHAWPEIYVENQGWMVVDITPSQAENEQELIPDEKLLEELMSKIDPAEEFLPPPEDSTNQEDDVNSVISRLVTKTTLVWLFIISLISWVLLKSWFRFGYRITGDNKTKTIRAYSSFASLMNDMGFHRHSGETRLEYANRLNKRHGIDAFALTGLYQTVIYNTKSEPIEQKHIEDALSKVDSFFEPFSNKLKKLLAFFSPFSLTHWNRW